MLIRQSWQQILMLDCILCYDYKKALSGASIPIFCTVSFNAFFLTLFARQEAELGGHDARQTF